MVVTMASRNQWRWIVVVRKGKTDDPGQWQQDFFSIFVVPKVGDLSVELGSGSGVKVLEWLGCLC